MLTPRNIGFSHFILSKILRRIRNYGCAATQQETITITGLSSDYYEVIRTDTADFKILEAIADLKVPYPKADKINSLAKLDPEELGARLGVLEMEGYLMTQSQTEIEGSGLPNGISAAGLTNQGKRALAGPRW
jgi:hypothetical protein